MTETKENLATRAIIGIYEIGWEKVQIALREGVGGEFYFFPDDIACSEIVIGADSPTWDKILARLLHETQEYSAARLQVRYFPREGLSGDLHAYLFVMTHPQFSEICSMAADCIYRCYDDLKKGWQEWNRARGREEVGKT